MAIAWGQTDKATGGGATGGSTPGVTTTTGSTFLICVTYAGTFTSVSDSKSNTYVQVDSTRQSGASAQNTRVYICVNGTGGASHTATLLGSGMGGGWAIYLTEITGAATASALDVAVGAAITAASTIITPTLTATAGNRLVVCYMGCTGGNAADIVAFNQSLVLRASYTNGTAQIVSGIATLASSSFNAAITATTAVSTPPAGIIAFTLKELTTVPKGNNTGRLQGGMSLMSGGFGG